MFWDLNQIHDHVQALCDKFMKSNAGIIPLSSLSSILLCPFVGTFAHLEKVVDVIYKYNHPPGYNNLVHNCQHFCEVFNNVDKPE